MDYNFPLATRCKQHSFIFASRLFLEFTKCTTFRLAYRSGVTVGVTAPTSNKFLSGLGVAFSTGLPHRLAHGAVLQDITALHISILSSSPSISTQIAALRHLLSGQGEGELGKLFRKVARVRH